MVTLFAIGAENDSIRFTEADTTGYYLGNNTGWGGITFGGWKVNSTKDDYIDGELDYCIIEYGDGITTYFINLELQTILEYLIIRLTVYTYTILLGHLPTYSITDFIISNNNGDWINLWSKYVDFVQLLMGLFKNNFGGGIKCDGRSVGFNNIIIDGNGNPNSSFGGIYLYTANNCYVDSLTVIKI